MQYEARQNLSELVTEYVRSYYIESKQHNAGVETPGKQLL
jgi:hypothetical protein